MGVPAAMVGIAACLWGVSGTAAQWLMQADGVSTAWLTTVRMGVAGIVLLAVLAIWGPAGTTFALWQSGRGLLRFLLFALAGLLGVQYTYLAAIHASNAATATLLQYVAPLMIAGTVAVATRTRPTRGSSAMMALAVLGTWLLVSDGRMGTLAIGPAGLFWGLLSAATLALYSLAAPPLLSQHGTLSVMAWSMVVGAAAMALIRPPTTGAPSHWTLGVAGLVATVAVGGTLIAFSLFLASLSRIPVPTAAWLASVEPVAAAVSSHLFLGVSLTPIQLLGGALVLVAAATLGARRHGDTAPGDPIMVGALDGVESARRKSPNKSRLRRATDGDPGDVPAAKDPD